MKTYDCKIILKKLYKGVDWVGDGALNMPIEFSTRVKELEEMLERAKLKKDDKVYVWNENNSTKKKRRFAFWEGKIMCTYPNGIDSWAYDESMPIEKWSFGELYK